MLHCNILLLDNTSLQDILQIDKYQLDNVFRYSIATDIIEGMNFLHRLNFVHGQLTSTNCYVDYKWNAVVGDWGENSLHATQKVAFVAFEPLYRAARDKENNRLNDYYRSLFWSAPETLHRDNLDYMISSSHGFQSDIYSCGIVLYEIFTNLLPYENLIEERNQWRPQEVLLAVQKDNIRPSIPDEAIAKYRKVISQTFNFIKRQQQNSLKTSKNSFFLML
jgi:serine/threonine protein kinase